MITPSNTAIVSDLHLGSATGNDLARDTAIRTTLLNEIAAAERVVLLGDLLELLERPLSVVLASARAFLEELGERMQGRQIVLVPGNHDHRLAEPLLRRLALEGRPLGLAQRVEPEGKALGQIASWLGDAKLEVAYPGIWLRDDVYATHGHYMDCHRRLPRLDCVAAAAAMRVIGAPGPSPNPKDYERVLRPAYRLGFGLAQGGLARSVTGPAERAWRLVLSSSRGPRGARPRGREDRSGLGLRLGIRALNRLLRAEFDDDLSGEQVSRDGIAAAIELADALNLNAAHVITGHTHRSGPSSGEDEWLLAGGGRLHNTGSWFLGSALEGSSHPKAARHWPGTVTWLEQSGAPSRVPLLADHSAEELQAVAARLRSGARMKP